MLAGPTPMWTRSGLLNEYGWRGFTIRWHLSRAGAGCGAAGACSRVWVNDLTGSQNEWIRVVPDGCIDIVWTGTSLIVDGPDTPVHSRSASARNRGGRSLSSWGGFVVAGRASQPFRAS